MALESESAFRFETSMRPIEKSVHLRGQASEFGATYLSTLLFYDYSIYQIIFSYQGFVCVYPMAGINHNGLTVTSEFVITSFITLALYNVLELGFIIFGTFKRLQGLYFWSMVVGTFGIALNAIGYLLKFLQPSSTNRFVYIALVGVGWSLMVTGQSLVLFSRLHLLVRSKKIIRLIFLMILADAVACHPPTIALFYGVNSENPGRFRTAYSIFERFQLCVFFLQEAIISTVYVVQATKLLRVRSSNAGLPGGPAPREFMWWLIAINVVVGLLDSVVIALEFSGRYALQTSCKALVYSVKLKLEISILNKMVEVIKARNPSLFDTQGLRKSILEGTRSFGIWASTITQGRGGDIQPAPVLVGSGRGEATAEETMFNQRRSWDNGVSTPSPEDDSSSTENIRIITGTEKRCDEKDCNSMRDWMGQNVRSRGPLDIQLRDVGAADMRSLTPSV